MTLLDVCISKIKFSSAQLQPPLFDRKKPLKLLTRDIRYRIRIIGRNQTINSIWIPLRIIVIQHFTHLIIELLDFAFAHARCR